MKLTTLSATWCSAPSSLTRNHPNFGGVEEVKRKISQRVSDGKNDDADKGVQARAVDPVIAAFLDQLAANFEVTVMGAQSDLVLRVANKAVSVSVLEYFSPTEQHPTCPRILRLFVHPVSALYSRDFMKLGIPFNPNTVQSKVIERSKITWKTDLKTCLCRAECCVTIVSFHGPQEVLSDSRLKCRSPRIRLNGIAFNPKYFVDCRMEFSVLPTELPLLSTWTAEWICAQESRSPIPPPIPILLAGEQSFFTFVGDPNETAPLVEFNSKDRRAALSSGDPSWLDIEYLWSSAARATYNEWNKDHSG